MQVVIWGADERATVLSVPLLDIPTIKGEPGQDGASAVITSFTDEAAFESYEPGPLEIAVLTSA